MITRVTRKGWRLVWHGLAVMLAGLAALVWPVATLAALRWLFGVYALADGFIIVTQLAHHELYRGWRLQLRGLASIVLGGLMGFWASVTAPALVATIAAWVILAGAWEARAVDVAVGHRPSAWGCPDQVQAAAHALKGPGTGY